MSRCGFEERLSPLADGELAAAEAAEVTAHLGHCDACRRRLALLQAVAGFVKRAPMDIAPPALTERLLALGRESSPNDARVRPAPAWLRSAQRMLRPAAGWLPVLALAGVVVSSLRDLEAATGELAASHTRGRLWQVTMMLEEYRRMEGKYPTRLENLGTRAALRSLRATPRGKHLSWTSAVTDAWGTPLVYRVDAARGHCMIYSRGPDRRDDHGAPDDVRL